MTEALNTTEKENGSQVRLRSGQDLVVRLGSNPSTGYRWQVEEVDEAILKQVGMAQYEPAAPDDAPLLGQPGQETMRFQAASAGQTRLLLAYRRPWEDDAAVEKTFMLEVVVN